MPELPDSAELRSAWLNQPEEQLPVDLEQIYSRRTRELVSTTRSEILSSIGAALFFGIVVAWRFAGEQDRLVQYGCAAVVLWAAITIFRFRLSIRPNMSQPDFFASTGVEHYRTELFRRRDHLRSAWVWHGPLWLAGIVSMAALAGRVVPGRLWDALPVLLLLAGCAAIGVRRRLRQAAELQHEIEELTGGSPVHE
jgi:hypothetical protein